MEDLNSIISKFWANHIFEENFSLEDELLPELFKDKKRVAGFLSKTTFIDIGLPQDYNRAAKVLSRHCGTF